MPGQPGRDVPDPVAERVRSAFPRSWWSWKPRRRVQAARSAPILEAVALLPGRGGSLLIRAGGDQGLVHVDDQPPGQGLPGNDQPRGTRWACPRSAPTRARGPEPARGQSGTAWPGCRPGPGRAVPPTRSVRSPAPGPGAPAGRWRSCWRARALSPWPPRPAPRPRSSSGDVPAFRSAAVSCAVSPALGGLAAQDRADVADQAGPAAGDLQGMIPPVMLHGEERTRALFAVKPSTDPSLQAPHRPAQLPISAE